MLPSQRRCARLNVHGPHVRSPTGSGHWKGTYLAGERGGRAEPRHPRGNGRRPCVRHRIGSATNAVPLVPRQRGAVGRRVLGSQQACSLGTLLLTTIALGMQHAHAFAVLSIQGRAGCAGKGHNWDTGEHVCREPVAGVPCYTRGPAIPDPSHPEIAVRRAMSSRGGASKLSCRTAAPAKGSSTAATIAITPTVISAML